MNVNSEKLLHMVFNMHLTRTFHTDKSAINITLKTTIIYKSLNRLTTDFIKYVLQNVLVTLMGNKRVKGRNQ